MFDPPLCPPPSDYLDLPTFLYGKEKKKNKNGFIVKINRPSAAKFAGLLLGIGFLAGRLLTRKGK
jgi:hypothetical protein